MILEYNKGGLYEAPSYLKSDIKTVQVVYKAMSAGCTATIFDGVRF